MYQICAGQIKAARAILDWSQEDMANAAGLSVATIRSMEMGNIPRGSTTRIIYKAVENAGLEFIENDGIRRKAEEVKIFRGVDSADAFFEDMLQTLKAKGGEVAAVVKSHEMMAQSCGTTQSNALERLKKLGDLANVKYLLSEADEPAFSLPHFQFRAIPKHLAGPVPYYIYGDKYALLIPEGTSSIKFVVFHSMDLSLACRRHFLILWESAAPFLAQETQQRRVAR